jgi:anti-sigma regulatory factor (Ser/Thr protein kinase)
MDTDPRPWTLTIPSDPRLLPTVRQFVAAVCQVGGLDQSTTDAIVLAIHEAAQNVIRHAHRNVVSTQFQVQCFLRADAVELRLLDEGEPFNLDSVPELDPAELRIGGRGLFLMRALMDELAVQPRAGRGNVLRMVKRCAPHTPQRHAV